MTYTFDAKLFDNELDKRFERFSASTLERIAKLCRGTFGVLGGQPVAEVLEARVVVEQNKKTKAGDPYQWVKARVKIPLTEKTSALVYEIEHGLRSEISISCSFRQRVCSICGVRGCSHTPGKYYDGKLCYMELSDIDDVYEWGFVEKVETEKKPRICEVLGVEVGERFTYGGVNTEFWVSDDGILQQENVGERIMSPCVCLLINNPEGIVRRTKFTDQEVADAKTILRMFGKDNFTYVQKDEDGWPGLMDGDGKDPDVGWCSIGMEKDMFPSLKPGQTVSLSEIVGGDD